jgi:hypothetical protein
MGTAIRPHFVGRAYKTQPFLVQRLKSLPKQLVGCSIEADGWIRGAILAQFL